MIDFNLAYKPTGILAIRPVGATEAQWEARKKMAIADGYPKEPGMYSATFYDRPLVSVDEQVNIFLGDMRTRKDFQIVSVQAQPNYMFIMYRHGGLKPDEEMFRM